MCQHRRRIDRLANVAIIVAGFIAVICPSANAQTTSEIVPPSGATVVAEVQGGGVQVYACRATAGNFAWTLVGPKALLVTDDGHDFGTHTAGPTWTSADGSSIVADGARPIFKVDRPNSVPALLLNVTSATGRGILTPARFVRRSDTEGGLPPVVGCDSKNSDATVARHYSAVYTFYR